MISGWIDPKFAKKMGGDVPPDGWKKSPPLEVDKLHGESMDLQNKRSRLLQLLHPPRPLDALYRLPWSVALVCAGYLLAGELIAINSWSRAPYDWGGGAYWQSYFAASMLLYATVSSAVALAIFGWKRRDIAGLLILGALIWVLLGFEYCFLHKPEGFAVWPTEH